MNLNKYDILTLKSTLLYILNKNKEGLSFIHIFKILYFANKQHLAKYGRVIINDTFYALPDGPVPTILYDIFKHKKGELKFSSDEEQKLAPILDAIIIKNDFIVNTSEVYDDLDISKSAIECLNISIKENKELSYSEISDKSHDKAWEQAHGNQNKKMNIFEIAKAGGANSETVNYLINKDYISKILM